MTDRGITLPSTVPPTGTGNDRRSGAADRRRGSRRPVPDSVLAAVPRHPIDPIDPIDPIGTIDRAEPVPMPTASDPARFINGELSWLDFGARLLDLVADRRFPLLERVRYLAIFAEGLDEFFQVRVAGLEDQVAAGLRAPSPDGMRPTEQLAAITSRALELVERHSDLFLRQIRPALTAAGVVLADWHTLDATDRTSLGELFGRRIFPILTPLAMGQGHPFPAIADLSLNLVVRVADPLTAEERIAQVKVPPLLPRLVPLADGRRFVPVEQVVAAHLEEVFPGMRIEEHQVFRVSRNIDLSVDQDETDDLLAAVELELHRRRFGQAVRLEVSSGISTELLDMLITEVEVSEGSVYLVDVPLDLSGLASLTGLDRPDLSAEPWIPVVTPPFGGDVDVFSVLAGRDVLVHHPYESFSGSVEAFVAAAARDPDVLAIKQTLYRTGPGSPIVASLIDASRAGKQVTVVVELQARFDERTNIAWARVLEEAGVQVIYGLAGVKTHAKICLVVRREGADVRRYCHIGTGNYNAETARAYEDLGLFTSDPAVGADVGELFNLLSGSGEPPRFRRLMVSPLTTRSALLEAIDAERRAGADGRIVIKTNGLTDPETIDALYRASQAGVSVDLVVRGRCCLRPGVPGLSERIRVRSIVGRYLEHSRVFCFGGGAGRPVRVALGSADLTERSLDRRVEVVVPIADPALQRRVARLLDWALLDQATSWELGPDGGWTRSAPDLPPHSLGLSLQAQFQMQALAARRTRPDAARRAPTAPSAAPGPVPEARVGRAPPARGSAPGPGPSPPVPPVPPAPLQHPGHPGAPGSDPWWRRWALRLR